MGIKGIKGYFKELVSIVSVSVMFGKPRHCHIKIMCVPLPQEFHSLVFSD